MNVHQRVLTLERWTSAPWENSRCSWAAISQLTYGFFHVSFVSFGGQRQSLLHSSHLKTFRVPRSSYVLLATMGCCRMWYHYATNDLWLQHLLIKQKTMAKQQIPQRFPGLPLPFLYAPKGPKDPRAPPQCLAETPGVVLTSWRGIGGEGITKQNPVAQIPIPEHTAKHFSRHERSYIL